MLIFAEKKQDVDAILEYLLLKGIEAVAIHGGKGMYFSHIYSPICSKCTGIYSQMVCNFFKIVQDIFDFF